MKKSVFALFVVAFLLFSLRLRKLPLLRKRRQILKPSPVAKFTPGMRGIAYTVFQGVKPEAMDVEVLGVLHNVNGPKGDVILVRLHGQKVEYTGVVAGMSGSPVYIEGKLAGRWRFALENFRRSRLQELLLSPTCWRSTRWTSRPAKRALRPSRGECGCRQDGCAGRGCFASGIWRGICGILRII